MSDLIKAWKNGVRGKYRRVDGGKVKFIRSNDNVVEKEAVTASGYAGDMGSPDADVMMTEEGECKCGRKKGKPCTCNTSEVSKSECPHGNGEDCGLCKEACDCEDVEKCACKAKALDSLIKALEERVARYTT